MEGSPFSVSPSDREYAEDPAQIGVRLALPCPGGAWFRFLSYHWLECLNPRC